MKILIPMAGLGSRFKELAHLNPEYAIPKPFIPIKGVPLVKWATSSYPFLQQYPEDEKPVKYPDLIFIVLQVHEDEFGISEKLKKLYSPEINVVVIKNLTRGAAES